MNIHPQAIVSPQAKLGQDVTIGPYCIIEADVELGDGCTLASSVVVKNGTTLGANNFVFEGTVLGGLPQHVRMPDRPGRLNIGIGNIFREHCTVHRALHEGTETRLGDCNLLMVGSHIAHDCQVGNNTIFANNALLAGHVSVGDRAFLSGGVGVHQFCRIGKLAMVGGHTKIVQDVPPYVLVDGANGNVVGLNLVGLRRNGFVAEEIAELKSAYRLIYRRGLKWREVVDQLRREFPDGPAADFHEFLGQGTRGFVQERRLPPAATIKIRRDDEEDNEQGELHSKAG